MGTREAPTPVLQAGWASGDSTEGPRGPGAGLRLEGGGGLTLSPEHELVHTPIHVGGLVPLGLGVADGHADTADSGMTDPVQSPPHGDGGGRHVDDLQALDRAGSWVTKGLLSQCRRLFAPGGGQGLQMRLRKCAGESPRGPHVRHRPVWACQVRPSATVGTGSGGHALGSALWGLLRTNQLGQIGGWGQAGSFLTCADLGNPWSLLWVTVLLSVTVTDWVMLGPIGHRGQGSRL